MGIRWLVVCSPIFAAAAFVGAQACGSNDNPNSGSTSSGGGASGGGSGSSSGSSSGAQGTSSGGGSSSGSNAGSSSGTASGSGSGSATGSSSGSASGGDGGLMTDDAGNIPDAMYTSPLCSCGGGAPANCAVWQHVYMTNYGFIDNSPPSAIIQYPNSGPKGHSQATEGSGTYADPITCATDIRFSQGGATLSPGTMVYNPITQKYYIVEDGCKECSQDYNCVYDDDDDAGTPGDPPSPCKKDTYFHIDFWMGPSMDLGTTLDNMLQNCEGISTLGDAYNVNYAIDGGPGYGTTDGTVIINPPDGLPVRMGPLYTAAGVCWTNAQVLPIEMGCH